MTKLENMMNKWAYHAKVLKEVTDKTEREVTYFQGSLSIGKVRIKQIGKAIAELHFEIRAEEDGHT